MIIYRLCMGSFADQLEIVPGLRQQFLDEVAPVDLACGLADQGQVHPGGAVGMGKAFAADERRKACQAGEAAQAFFEQWRYFGLGFIGHRAAKEGLLVQAASG